MEIGILALAFRAFVEIIACVKLQIRIRTCEGCGCTISRLA